MQELLKKLLFGNAGGGNGGAPALSLSFTDGGTFDPRITFSRGTNATLTGSDGLIQYAPHNLLTNSEDFEAAGWTKRGTCTVTANAVAAPDGTTTADLISGLGVSGNDIFQASATVALNTPASPSFYINKVSTTGTLRVGNPSDSSKGAWNVNLALVDPGWQRITLTHPAVTVVTSFVGNGSGDGLIFLAQAGGPLSFYLWGAQLNIGSTAQSYNSTTPKNLLGFTQEPENAAWTKSNSYVQQNLLTWSQDFDNAAWAKSTSSVTANATVAPDGSLTADSLIEDTSTNQHATSQIFGSGVVSTTYTFSVFLKQNTRTKAQIAISDNATGDASTVVDLVAGTVTAASVSGNWSSPVASIQPANNGYYRVVLTVTKSAIGNTSVVPIIRLYTTSNSYTGDGTSGIFIWGAQLVQGSTAGDYTQTTSAAAPTRYVNWDGTLTGRKLVENTAATIAHRVQQSVTIPSAPISGTAYLKAAERNWAYLRFDDASSTKFAYFDLSSGVVGTVDSGLAAGIVNVGGGWYRCSAVFAAPAATASGVFVVGTTTANNTQSYTGDGTSGIYVSDFQLSNSASVDPYVYNPQAAAASAAFYGPRVDYNPVTLASNGLLIEEQRTNLLTYSEQFDNLTGWGLQNVTVTANASVAPDGNTTADRAVVTANSLYTALRSTNITVTPSTTYTLTFWLNTTTSLAGNTIRVFNITGGTDIVGGQACVYSGGWVRQTCTFTTPVGCTTIQVYPVSMSVGASAAGSFFDLWGAQLEAGSFATSYIPTVASQVTRNADSASMLGDNFYTWYNPNQGTLFTEGGGANAAGSARLAGISDGTVSNRIINYLSGATQLAGLISSGGAAQANPTVNVASAASANKLAQGYLVNNVNIAANGTLGTLDTVSNIPSVTLMRLGVDEVGTGAYLNGTIRRISYYSTRLSDASLQQITS